MDNKTTKRIEKSAEIVDKKFQQIVPENKIDIIKSSPTIKIWKMIFFNDIPMLRTDTIEKCLSELRINCELKRTSQYITLKFNTEIERHKFLVKYNHPSVKRNK